jgi:DNA mismatch repair protein MutS2
METVPLVSNEISIRGLEKAEALENVDAFLDKAVLQGMRTVTVIHGIGRGILKRALYDMLKKDSRVASVRPGEPARGGDGVAIVDLK